MNEYPATKLEKLIFYSCCAIVISPATALLGFSGYIAAGMYHPLQEPTLFICATFFTFAFFALLIYYLAILLIKGPFGLIAELLPRYLTRRE